MWDTWHEFAQNSKSARLGQVRSYKHEVLCTTAFIKTKTMTVDKELYSQRT